MREVQRPAQPDDEFVERMRLRLRRVPHEEPLLAEEHVLDLFDGNEDLSPEAADANLEQIGLVDARCEAKSFHETQRPGRSLDEEPLATRERIASPEGAGELQIGRPQSRSRGAARRRFEHRGLRCWLRKRFHPRLEAGDSLHVLVELPLQLGELGPLPDELPRRRAERLASLSLFPRAEQELLVRPWPDTAGLLTAKPVFSPIRPFR